MPGIKGICIRRTIWNSTAASTFLGTLHAIPKIPKRFAAYFLFLVYWQYPLLEEPNSIKLPPKGPEIGEEQYTVVTHRLSRK